MVNLADIMGVITILCLHTSPRLMHSTLSDSRANLTSGELSSQVS